MIDRISAEDRFRLAVEAAGAARVMHWLAGPDKLRTFFNQAWLNFTGRTLDQELENGGTGPYQWVLDNGSPQFGPDGAFFGYSGVCVDASRVKHSHEAEFAAQKLQSLGLMT